MQESRKTKPEEKKETKSEGKKVKTVQTHRKLPLLQIKKEYIPYITHSSLTQLHLYALREYFHGVRQLREAKQEEKTEAIAHAKNAKESFMTAIITWKKIPEDKRDFLAKECLVRAMSSLLSSYYYMLESAEPNDKIVLFKEYFKISREWGFCYWNLVDVSVCEELKKYVLEEQEKIQFFMPDSAEAINVWRDLAEVLAIAAYYCFEKNLFLGVAHIYTAIIFLNNIPNNQITVQDKINLEVWRKDLQLNVKILETALEKDLYESDKRELKRISAKLATINQFLGKKSAALETKDLSSKQLSQTPYDVLAKKGDSYYELGTRETEKDSIEGAIKYFSLALEKWKLIPNNERSFLVNEKYTYTLDQVFKMKYKVLDQAIKEKQSPQEIIKLCLNFYKTGKEFGFSPQAKELLEDSFDWVENVYNDRKAEIEAIQRLSEQAGAYRDFAYSLASIGIYIIKEDSLLAMRAFYLACNSLLTVHQDYLTSEDTDRISKYKEILKTRFLKLGQDIEKYLPQAKAPIICDVIRTIANISALIQDFDATLVWIDGLDPDRKREEDKVLKKIALEEIAKQTIPASVVPVSLFSAASQSTLSTSEAPVPPRVSLGKARHRDNS